MTSGWLNGSFTSYRHSIYTMYSTTHTKNQHSNCTNVCFSLHFFCPFQTSLSLSDDNDMIAKNLERNRDKTDIDGKKRERAKLSDIRRCSNEVVKYSFKNAWNMFCVAFFIVWKRTMNKVRVWVCVNYLRNYLQLFCHTSTCKHAHSIQSTKKVACHKRKPAGVCTSIVWVTTIP